MIKVECQVSVYERNNEQVKELPTPKLVVRSHWNGQEFVRIEYNGAEVTVLAAELMAAIKNATNCSRY